MKYLRELVVGAGILAGTLVGASSEKLQNYLDGYQSYVSKSYAKTNFTSRVGGAAIGGLAGLLAGIGTALLIEKPSKYQRTETEDERELRRLGL